MEQIQLNNGTTFKLLDCGIQSTKESLVLQFLAEGKGLNELEQLFQNEQNVKVITLLSEEGEVLKRYQGYTCLTAIEKKKQVIVGHETIVTEDNKEEQKEQKADVIVVTLIKESIEQRISKIETTLLDTQLGIAEVYEKIIQEGAE